MATSQDHDAYRPFTTEGHPGPPPFVPRPAPRPAVEPAAAELFGRPSGVIGAFADQPAGPIRQWAAAPPTPEALEAAFGRPSPSDEHLQRPPGRNGARPSPGLAGEDDFWPQGAARDPWRDPWAAAVLGDPAMGQRDVNADEPPRPGARLSVAEVLFGRRVTNRALAALAAVALLIGGVGGLVGRLTAEGGTLLNDPGITLAQVQPAIDRPAGSVAAVAGRVLPAVVSLEYRVGDQGGFGSGVVIDSHGYLLTNNHVVAPPRTSRTPRLEAVFQ